MPDEARIDGQKPAPSPRRPRPQPVAQRSLLAMSPRATQPTPPGRRGHPTAVAPDDARPLRAHDRTEGGADAARSTRARYVASLLHPVAGRSWRRSSCSSSAQPVSCSSESTRRTTHASARREDLIQLLDGLSAESRRLEGEITQLEQTRSNLRSGADTQRVARAEAERHLIELSIWPAPHQPKGEVSGCGSPIRMQPWMPGFSSMPSRRCATRVPK